MTCDIERKKYNDAIFTFKCNVIWVHFSERCSIVTPIVMPRFIGTTEIDLEKSSQNVIFQFKMVAISQVMVTIGVKTIYCTMGPLNVYAYQKWTASDRRLRCCTKAVAYSFKCGKTVQVPHYTWDLTNGGEFNIPLSCTFLPNFDIRRWKAQNL